MPLASRAAYRPRMKLREGRPTPDVRAAVSARLGQLADQWSPPLSRGDAPAVPDLPGPSTDTELNAHHPRMRGDLRRTRAVLAVLAVAVVVAIWTWWQGRPSTVESLPPAAGVASIAPNSWASSPAGAPTAGAPVAPSEVIVHVVGAVASPGIVHLPVGARVDDAIAAVGGASSLKALASVNLARVLVDGEQIVVDSAGLAATSGRSGQAMVSLNSADVTQLDSLPGVGPVLAQRIVDWRKDHGPFHSLDELSEVSGIGTALMADLKNRVRL